MTSRGRAWLLAGLLGAAGCLELAPEQPFCADSKTSPAALSRPVTWHADIQPLVQARCAFCHEPGGAAPMPLTTYEEVYVWRVAAHAEVMSRHMPPWQAARCCNEFRNDYSLTDEQVALFDAWVKQGAPQGNAGVPVVPVQRVGGLSRVDVTVRMPQPYFPQPEPGRIDDFRCFVLDWPIAEETFVTGMNPVPGARRVVHHLIVAVVEAKHGEALRKREGRDGRPGFACEGALGSIEVKSVLGGSLVGGDYPEPFGSRVGPNSKLVLNVHYSLPDAVPEADQTRLQFKLSPIAREMLTLPVANPAWLLDDAMRVRAGDGNAVYRFQFDPRLLTRGRDMLLMGYTPHMHALARRQKFSVVRSGGSIECMTEIPNWHFGWEQPYWFATPIPFQDGDDFFIQCHFDNSADNQPVVNGQRLPPRDIAWGSDNQDMCAGFVNFAFLDGKGWKP